MRYTTAALLGLLAVQQAAACDICEWGQALGLPSCQNSCNQCTQQQQQGLDFSQCPAGSSSFGGLNFGGCSIGSWLGLKKKSFIPRGGKRSLGNADALFDTEEHEFYKRNDQCALGALTSGGGPSFSCGAGTNAFSISNMLVSCDHDTPAQLTYSYDSGPQAGQTCQQQVQLSAGAPQTITNTQCGGASSVQCALGANAPVPSCNLGIHSVNFDCSGCGGGSGGGSPPTPAAPPPAAASTAPPAAPPPPAAPSVPAAPPPPPPAAPSVPAAPPPPPPAAPSVPAAPPPPPPANTPPAAPPPPAVTPPVVPPPANTPPAVPPPAVTPPVVPPPGVSTVPGVPPPFSPSTSLSTSISVSVSTSPSTPTYPANGSTVIIQTTQPLITTEVVYTTLTSCNGYNTVTHGNYTSIQTVQTLSTLLLTSTQTVCTKCTAPPETVSPASTISTTVSISNSVQSVVVTQSVATSVQAAPAPSLLPSCLQTWIKLTGCKDNSDSNCFCNDANFTKNVQECVSAWSNHKDQEAQALSYLAGICAPHIGNNPGIITNIPSTITLQPTPAPTNTGNGAPAAPGGQTAGAGQPVTTISLSTTVTVQCSAGGSSMAGGCSSTSVLNTQVAVPQVAFTTAQPGKVGLVAGTPAPAPAVATPAPAAASPNSPASPANTPPAPAAPAGTGAITPYYSPSATVQPFTGAATNLGGSSLLVSVVVAVAGLFVL